MINPKEAQEFTKLIDNLIDLCPKLRKLQEENLNDTHKNRLRKIDSEIVRIAEGLTIINMRMVANKLTESQSKELFNSLGARGRHG